MKIIIALSLILSSCLSFSSEFKIINCGNNIIKNHPIKKICLGKLKNTPLIIQVTFKDSSVSLYQTNDTYKYHSNEYIYVSKLNSSDDKEYEIKIDRDNKKRPTKLIGRLDRGNNFYIELN